MTLTFHNIGNPLSKEEIDTIMELMNEAFPESERRTEEKQRELFNHTCYNQIVLREDKQVVGALMFWELKGCVFGEHLAVDSSLRNGGLGKKAVEKLKSYSDKIIVLEIELPIEEIQKRRCAFYERNGFIINPFYYQQLPLRNGFEPIDMHFMSNKPLDEKKFIELRDDIYKVVYSQI